MNNKSGLRIVFMGTPAFALPSFEALCASHHQVIAAYTQPPRPAGRGQKLTASVIETAAHAHFIPAETPINFKAEGALATLAAYQPDVIVVAAYGLLLPEAVLDLPRFGAINIHPSLLPRWRGAAPIHRPLLAGDAETGMTIMQMARGLDTGDILLQQPIPITDTESYANLHDHLALLGSTMLLEALDQLHAHGTIQAIPQEDAHATYAAKLQKEEATLTFHEPIQVIDRKIRALNPWPGTEFTLRGEKIKILEATIMVQQQSHIPGTILNTEMHIACHGGILQPTLLKRAGKASQPVEEFLHGFMVEAGEVAE
jgi:methionyl-tRNA formyltransferase